ncbi:MAG TPA: hypothetical protein PLS49_07120, partial [Candidatus Woesebacteria bacterium]|nr:hypothetical protein [Candidatus Woesebacteria bacterium]
MWLPPEAMTQDVSASNVESLPKGPPSSSGEGISLAEYTHKQSEGSLNTKELVEAYRDMIGAAEFTITDDTNTTYANVLASEFLSLIRLDEKSKSFQPDEWQRLFIQNVNHELKKNLPDFQITDKTTKDDIYAASSRVFYNLLTGDPKKAEQWINAAM